MKLLQKRGLYVIYIDITIRAMKEQMEILNIQRNFSSPQPSI